MPGMPQRVRVCLHVRAILHALDQGCSALPRTRWELGACAEPGLQQHHRFGPHALRDLDDRGMGGRDVRRSGLDRGLQTARARLFPFALDIALPALDHDQLHVPHQSRSGRHRRELRELDVGEGAERAAGPPLGIAEEVGELEKGLAQEGLHLRSHAPGQAAGTAALCLQAHFEQALRAGHHGVHHHQHHYHGTDHLPCSEHVVVDLPGDSKLRLCRRLHA
mmetsp:Transcript_94293/g.219093  ORF Transcript_94293/g.219093 Transcript_94293/m.219093 type:complete len:221 (+) Transcript_94293:701-1363(+)